VKTDSGPRALDPSTLRGLIFDLDGTLVDSYRAIAASLNHARAAYGLQALDDGTVRRSVGHGLEDLIACHVGTERVAQGVRLFREHYAGAFAGGTVALPGAVDTLRRLHSAGYRIGVASNKPARFSGPILEQLGMRRYVGSVGGPDVAGSTKPDPAMIRLCLDELELGSGEAAYVGDMVLDVESADRAGLPVVLVPGGSSTPEELRGTGRMVVDSLAALADLLLGRSGQA
jgi:phosphoglycolate phosphatase